MARREENYAIAKSVIPFTKIITSENSVGSLGYDGQGNFIAPISGLYIFHVHVLKCQGDRSRSKWIVLVVDLTQNIFFIQKIVDHYICIYSGMRTLLHRRRTLILTLRLLRSLQFCVLKDTIKSGFKFIFEFLHSNAEEIKYC